MLAILKQNKILFIVLAVVIVLFVGYAMSDKTPEPGPLQKQSASGSSDVEQEILQLLMDVQSIRLDSSIFQDPAFATLRDFSREIVQEPSGRENPFAPVGGAAVAGAVVDFGTSTTTPSSI